MDTTYGGTMRKRINAGFTMMEMLIAVAILVILMAVAFVGVINYQRSMKQLELDGTAKEIFIAAQNHLSMAQSQGVLKDVDKGNGELVGVTGPNNGANSPIRYWYVGADKTKLDRSNKSTLYEMLPWGSLDDTVRLGGSYVIEYNLDTATVLNVFYSDQSPLSTYTFTPADYGKLFPAMVGDDNKATRLAGLDDQVIGWYGGQDLASRKPVTLEAPTIKVINAERLEVKVGLTSDQHSKNVGASVRIVMRGDTSKHSKIVDTIDVDSMSANSALDAKDGMKYSASAKVLDDITDNDKKFARQWCSSVRAGESVSDSESGPLIPGENISVYAEVYNNSSLSTIERSSTKHTNSLFADMMNENQQDGTSERIATVANIRHLENMDASISGYDLDALDKDGNATAEKVVKFKQVADLRWMASGSKKPVAFTSAIVEGTSKKPEDVQVYHLDGAGTKGGMFAPVTPQKKGTADTCVSYVLSYDGNNKKISNVKVDAESGNAGVFATLTSGSSVKNLELVDCSVKTSNGNAGALLGETSGSLTLTNILVHDSTGSVKSKIEGTKAVGGLVGQLTHSGSDSLLVDACAASLLVKATGADSVAGGLVGTVKDGVAITNSYAGGHTKDGAYETGADKMNVVAGGMAGGLVGSATGSGNTLERCYATTSASAATTAGGLVGAFSGTSIKSCYATGLVGGTATTKGAFVGSLIGSPTLEDNKYYQIISGDLKPVGDNDNAEVTGISALDKDAESFNGFYAADSRTNEGVRTNIDKAVPYDDPTLTQLYNGIYPLQTIKMLNPDAAGTWATTHYGDWPAPETLFINTKSAG